MNVIFKIFTSKLRLIPRWVFLVTSVALISVKILMVNKHAIINKDKGFQSGDQHGFLHVIIQFPLLLNGNDSRKVIRRQQEYIEALVKNVNHPLVEKVHVLCEDGKAMAFIPPLVPQYQRKLQLQNIGRPMVYTDAIIYASTALASRTCVIMNADCYIGDGFDKLNVTTLQQGTMYALTRRETPTQIARCGVRDFCGNTSKYIGSHDAFVMNLMKPLPRRIFKYLEYRPNVIGVENVLIYLMKTFGKFRVKNPCGILHVIHNHCNRKRANRLIGGHRLENVLNLPKGRAPFSGL